MLVLTNEPDYVLSRFRSGRGEPRTVKRTRTSGVVRGLAARGLGLWIINAIPGLPWTYDGQKVVAVPIAEELPNIRVVSLRLKKLATRPAVTVFAEFAKRHFAEVWPKLMQSAPRRRASASTRAGDRRR